MKNVLEDTTTIKNVAAEFYLALNTMFAGDVTPMLALWSHADDVTYLGPQGGIIVGWPNVKKYWEKQAALNLKGKVEPQDMHFFINGEIAITQNYEIGNNIINGKSQTVKIRATNIFRKENGKWKMISHQTDPLPYLQNMK